MATQAAANRSLVERQADLLTALSEAVAERDAAVEAYGVKCRGDERQRQDDEREALERIRKHFEIERDIARLAASQRLAANDALFERDVRAVEAEFNRLRGELHERSKRNRVEARRKYDERLWQINSAHEAVKDAPEKEFRAGLDEVEALAARVAEAERQEASLLAQYHQPLHEIRGADAAEDGEEFAGAPVEALSAAADDAEAIVQRLTRLAAARLFIGVRPIMVWLCVAALATVPVGMLTDWRPFLTFVGAFVVATLVSSVSLGSVYYLARIWVGQLDAELSLAANTARRARHAWRRSAEDRMRRQQAELARRRALDLRGAAKTYGDALATCREQRSVSRARMESSFGPRLAVSRRDLAQERARLEGGLPRTLAALDGAEKTELARAERDHRAIAEAFERWRIDTWSELVAAWRWRVEKIETEAADMSETSRRWYPPWDDSHWSAWKPPSQVAPFIPVGRLTLPVADFDSTKAQHTELAGDLPEVLRFPVAIELPARGSLVVRASGSSRSAAVGVLQNTCLRLLLGIPPGKVRFTFVDPVGLGENFAAFMHLADYDAELVANRIWTEPNLIEQRLADLTAHMANVIQKYLRNEYETIDQYNAAAGEVAEPYRVLVIANFPIGFTDAAVRHLASIATSGARCGVYVVVSVDSKQPAPAGFRLTDLEQSAASIVWREGKFNLKDERLASYPLEIDPLPTPELFTRLLQIVGVGAKDASKVEVPFEFIAPHEESWWTADSRSTVDVPLGRCGATKRQHLRLGHGTAQHVLIAGKTGSGKSTLLHTLITNAALRYSPDELEFYLIDFKKGVEFKTYATHALPHARVVAVESEREFGLSVLERLDAELRARGDLFRSAGAQDVASFRQANPGKAMPRILLIVDEFQEFFVEDDRVAQDASLLLDRLVRQGRAFGIHIHLGSQTLAGAYTLARSTLGQMAIRVALQCSETDAPLILSEENTAARLLGRPGEAIYNDANGRVEGNSPFQIAFLPEAKHDDYLRRVQNLAELKRHRPRSPQIVFEGNVLAEIGRNHLLTRLVEATAWPMEPPAPSAWLGEAIAIKDPTAAVFARQSGANLLIMSQRADAALAVTQAALVSLSSQLPPITGPTDAAQIYVLDGGRGDASERGTFDEVLAAMPQAKRRGGVRDAAEVVSLVATEIERRQQEREGHSRTMILILHDLPHLRALKRQDDDFGFSKSDAPNTPRQLAAILSDGPSVGVHVIAWCDTLANLNRMLDRQSLREFDLRVLFQMSATDSSHLIDSPAAGKLGPHRALFFHEAEGRLEKFRPYAVPTASYLEWLKRAFDAKSTSLPVLPPRETGGAEDSTPSHASRT